MNASDGIAKKTESLSSVSKFRQRLTLCSVLILSLVLCSCTAKVSYRFLDWLVAWSIDDYVDWNRSQRVKFDRYLLETLDWHQATQLPEYSQLLGQLDKDFKAPLTRDILQQRLDEITALWSAVLLNIEPAAVDLFATLTEQQALEFSRKLEKETAKIERKYSGSNQQQREKEYVKNAEKLIVRFVGRLSNEQKTAVKAWASRVLDTRGQWLQQRRLWADEFTKALDRRPGAQFNQDINRLFIRSQSLWSEEYRALLQVNIENTMDLIITLQQSLTEKQQQHLSREIRRWQRSFDELAMEANQ